MNEAEFAELAAGAALHALSPEDERRFRDALAAHPEWRDLAETDAGTAGLLAGAAAPVDPPADIRSTLLAQISGMPQGAEPEAERAQAAAIAPHGASSPEDPADPRAEGDAAPSSEAIGRPSPRRLRLLFALAACLALLVGIGAGAAALNGYLNRPAAVVALEEIRSADDAQQATVDLDGGGTATAYWSTSRRTAVLVADGIPELAEDKAYELWFVRGETPVSAGVFASEDGAATAVLDGELRAGDVIAVTVEKAGGSATGAPTSDPVIVIPTT